MFLHMSVILFTGGGGSESLSQGVSLWGFCPGGLCPRGVSVWGVCPGGLCPGGLCLGGSLSGGLCPGGLCNGDPPYGSERAVCILLECILDGDWDSYLRV